MANIYSKPVESRFVPTYAPINLDAINIGAQAMQKRQEENFAQLDALQEQARLAEQQLFEQDKELFRNTVGGIREQLDSLAADGDLSDAGRQIRSLANRFKERATAGPLGEAFRNYQNVQQRYKQIDESDLPDAEKQARKNAIIAGYKGAGQGGLDLSINTDDIDFNEFIKDTLGDVNQQKLVEGTDWTWNSKIGKFEKGEITTEGIPAELIQSTITNALSNNPGAMSAIRQRARVATAGQDEFVIEEDGEQKIVSREKKMEDLINRQMNQLVQMGAQKYGQRVTNMDFQTTAAGDGAMGAGGVDGVSYTGVKRGDTMAMDINISGFDDALDKISGSEATGNETEARELKGSLNRAMFSWVESSEDLSRDDAEFLMEMQEKIKNTEIPEKSAADVPVLSSGEGAGRFSPVMKYNTQEYKDALGEENISRFMSLKDNFDNWVSEGGGWTDKEYFLKDEDKIQDVTQLITRVSNPTDWKIYGMSDVESREALAPGDDGENVWRTFRFQSVAPPSDYAPTMISGTVVKDGEEVPVRLVEKRDPTVPSNVSDITDSILERYGGLGLEIKEQRKFEDIQPGFNFENIADKMPSELRAQATNDFVGVRKSKNGYQVQYGSGDNVNTFTTGDLIKNLYEYPPKSNVNLREFIDNLNKNGVLTPEEIGSILDGEETDTIKRKLEAHFTEPYEFKNKISAVEAGAKYSGT